MVYQNMATEAFRLAVVDAGLPEIAARILSDTDAGVAKGAPWTATSILHDVHDPLCGGCYAARPMVEIVANAGVAIVLHGGGLLGKTRFRHVDVCVSCSYSISVRGRSRLPREAAARRGNS